MRNTISRRISHSLGVVFLAAVIVPEGFASQAPVAVEHVTGDATARGKAQDHVDVGTVTLQQPFEHTFYFRNDSAETIDIAAVQLQPPLVAVGGTSRVAPGETGRLVVRLGQPRDKGRFEKQIVVRFKQASVESRSFVLSGTVVPSIELKPAYGFYVVAQRGQTIERAIELVNHEKQPLEITRADYDGQRLTTTLETLEAGRRYRVTVKTAPKAPAGRATESVRLVTANAKQPTLAIPVNVWIRDRVYTFPESLDLGLIDSARPIDSLTQSLMVYQVGGTNFQIAAETEIPFLNLTVSGSKFGDRFKITASIEREKANPGEIRGVIVVKTNDAEFPTVVIPVHGVVR